MGQIKEQLLLSKLWILTIIDLSIILNLSSGKIIVKPPSISIEQWQSDDDQKWRVIRNSMDAEVQEIYFEVENNTYAFGESAFGLMLNCTSNYPVEWVPNLKQGLVALFGSFLVGIDIRSVREFEDFDNQASYKYTSVLVVARSYKEFTGNYSCQSIDGKQELRKSIYLYVEGGNPAQTLVLSGQKFEIPLEDQRTLIFPCHVSSPNDEVQLHKMILQTRGFVEYPDWNEVEVKNGSGISYNPKIGFTINVPEFISPSEIIGSYRCIGITEDDTVLIDVLSSRMHTELPILPTRKTFVNPPAKLDYDSEKSLLSCCSNSQSPPDILILQCSTVHQCKLWDLVEKEVPILGNQIWHKAYNNYLIPRKNGSCSFLNLRVYGLTNFKILCKGNGIDIDTLLLYFYKNPSNGQTQNGQNQLSLPRIPRQNTFTLDLEEKVQAENTIGLFMSLTDKSVGLIPINDGDMIELFTSQERWFYCQVSQYFFASSASATWSLEMNDSSIIMIPNKKFKDNFRYNIINPTRLYLKAQKNSKIKSVTCHCPLWNSPGWRTKTIHFRFRAPVEPKIKDSNPEEVHWAVNSTDMTLKCQIEEGLPIPEITWKKDDKILGNNIFNGLTILSSNGSSTLTFLKVSTDIHGQYTCEAKNLIGVASKTTSLFVEVKHSKLVYWISAVLVISTALLMGIVIIKTREGSPFQDITD